ncbi:MAG: ATP-binding protein [Treponema sp.]
MVIRKEFQEILLRWQGKKIIKVVTGVRRCGKSTLLLEFQKTLLSQGVSQDCIQAFNLDAIENEHLYDYHTLYKQITENLIPQKMNYIFLDEIQMVPEFEKAINSLFLKENIDLYLTGSNAYMLSGEIATLLSGRYIEIKMLPLSFPEYCELCSEISGSKIEPNRKSYNQFVMFGGFPYVANLLNDKEMIRDYLRGIYSTIVLKDILQRKKISDSDVLEKITKYSLSNIGNLTSSKKVSDTLTSRGRKTASATVENCYTALTESYLFYKATRYDIKGKEFLKSLEKYYAVDTGLYYFMLGSKTGNEGFILENIVYLELLRRGYEIYVGKYGDMEVDFVAIKNGLPEYYQVSLSVINEDTLNRELKPLKAIKDSHPKFLITLDECNEISHDGIRQVYALDWICNKL